MSFARAHASGWVRTQGDAKDDAAYPSQALADSKERGRETWPASRRPRSQDSQTSGKEEKDIREENNANTREKTHHMSERTIADRYAA